jgi:hypothetical protein
MVDGISSENINIESVDVSLNLPATSLTFVDSIRSWLDDVTRNIMDGDQEVLSVIIGGLMLTVGMTYIWRKL